MVQIIYLEHYSKSPKKKPPFVLAPMETASPPRRDRVDSGTGLRKKRNLGAPKSRWLSRRE